MQRASQPQHRGNFFSDLQQAMLERPQKICFQCPGQEPFSFGAVDERAARFATLLKELGVEAGDRVVAQTTKSVDAFALYLGVLRAGGVYVPLNTAYTEQELEYFLHDAVPRVVITRADTEGRLSALAQRCDVPHHRVLDAATSATISNDADALDAAALDRDVVTRDAEDLAAIVYTSGTTGRSKGAMISHRALRENALGLKAIWGFEADDVLLHALPIFHIHGLFIAMHPTLLNGSTSLFLPAFDAAAVRELLPQATLLMGVPTFYSRLLAEHGFGPDDCRSIRVFISGSAPLTAQASDEWFERTGSRILERYGMTEAGIITSNPLNGERIAGTVGYPLPGVELRIADEQGGALAVGAVGAIEVRGNNLFSGYWRKPDKTAEEMREDAYFITGDLGSISADGRLTIVGRAKDLIISGGYNIYPKEIESVLDELPGVVESAVVGVPHADLGEGVVAVMVGDEQATPPATVSSALEAGLARFKHPRRFYWVDELPRNAMGKVQKNLLTERYRNAYADA
ncbi:MAG: AMP-binding protein [Pseudomonadota bacterium]